MSRDSSVEEQLEMTQERLEEARENECFEDAARYENVAEQLKKIKDGCKVCGDPDCNRGIAYVGADMIHADKHPENKKYGSPTL